MTVCNERGFSLIELLLFVIIGAIFIPASIVAFTTVMDRMLIPDYQVKARFYAEQKMEELTSTPYDLLGIRAKDAQPYPSVAGTTGYGLTWEIQHIDPTKNPIQDGTDGNYKRISVFVVSPDSSEYKVDTIVTKRPRS